MKGKQLALLLLLVAVVGGAGWYLQRGNRASWSETGAGAGGKVVNLPLNEVSSLVVKTSDGEVNLVKQGDTWTVQERSNYPAAYEKVSDLLRKVWDLKTVQAVKVGASQLPRLELVAPGKDGGSGTLLEFKDKDGKRLEALVLGKKHLKKGDASMGDMPGFPAGRYVMPVADKATVSLVSDSFEEATPKAEQWLKKDFVKIDGIKAITLAGTTDAQHWKLTRETPAAEWKLADAKPEEQLDSAKASPLSSLFASASFNDVLAPEAKPADTGLDKPIVATFETADNFTYTLKIGKLSGENYPVTIDLTASLATERTLGKDEKPEDKTRLDEEFKATQKRLEEKLETEKKFAGRPYLIAKFTIDTILKDRSGLLAEKKPEPPPASAPSAATPPGPMPPPLPGATAVTPPVSIPPQPPPAATPPPAPKPAPPLPGTTVVTPPVSIPPQPPPAATPPPAPKPAPPLPGTTVVTPPVSIPPQPPPAATPPPAPKPAPPLPGTTVVTPPVSIPPQPPPANSPAAPKPPDEKPAPKN